MCRLGEGYRSHPFAMRPRMDGAPGPSWNPCLRSETWGTRRGEGCRSHPFAMRPRRGGAPGEIRRGNLWRKAPSGLGDVVSVGILRSAQNDGVSELGL